jgi:sigma-E factor negative regulatory protein RseB
VIPLGVQRAAWAWLSGLVLGSLIAPGVARAADAPAALPTDDARAWITRIQAAANKGNYRGTLVFSAAGSMSSSRVLHFAVGDQVYEKLESLDGRQQQIYRHNDDVHTVWPQTRTAVIEKRGALAGWQTTPQAVEPGLVEQYLLRREGASRVAGREAEVLLLEPRDALRYAQRLWADSVTGLMLRADVLGAGPDRAVLESAAFSEVEIGVKPQPKAVTQVASQIEGFELLRPTQQRTQLEAEGWWLARPVSGFRLTGCVRRQLDGAPSGRAVAAPVLQAVFSDGLAHVSLFIEPFDARRHKGEMQAHLGATTTVTLRRLEHWFTAVGDAPASTLRLLVDALERRR